MALNITRATPAEAHVTALFDHLEAGSKQGYIGEAITQLEHALQAANMATPSHFNDKTIIVALLYDIGQLSSARKRQQMIVSSSDGEESVGIVGHEKIGAAYLRSLGYFDKVCEFVESHVVSIRYLYYSNKGHYDSSSPASKSSLKFQGGPMDREEAGLFERDPLANDKIRLRKWDDAANVVGARVPGIKAYRDMTVSHLERADEGN